MKDAKSTGNIQKHAKECWGPEMVDAADQSKDAKEACHALLSRNLAQEVVLSLTVLKGGVRER